MSITIFRIEILFCQCYDIGNICLGNSKWDVCLSNTYETLACVKPLYY